MKITDREHLLRLLKAREFNTQEALKMWLKWIEWRKEYNIDSINVDDIENELISGKAFWHKYDN